MKALEMKGITKKFPGLMANDHIDFELNKGEVHVLLGENGAGKSTLMNILSGLYKQDEGEIFLLGKKVDITSPKRAIELGIGMVYQHFMLIPAMTVVENIILGLESDNEPWLEIVQAKKRINELSEKYGFDIKPDTIVSELSVGEQQRLEIIKALYRGADILILDEPTAVLTPEESNNLFRVIKKLTSEGVSVIFITHKLKEVMEISERVTVLRLGKKIKTVMTKDVTPNQLANMMVGREVIYSNFEKRMKQDIPILKLRNISYINKEGKKALTGIDLTIYKGEILGIAGVDGNGQSELAKVTTGLLKPTAGDIFLEDKNMKKKNVMDFINENIAHIPEDRNLMGLAGTMSIIDNLVMKCIGKYPFSKFHGWKLEHRVIRDHAAVLEKSYDIRCSGLNCTAAELSGGNQQKVIVARELEKIPKLLVAVHPTRGLDIGATDFVHREIIKARDNGAAVMLISGDLDEIFRLSDRIACIYEGKIMGIVDGLYENIEKVGLMMAGTHLHLGGDYDER